MSKFEHTPEPWYEGPKQFFSEPSDPTYREIFTSDRHFNSVTNKGFCLTGFISKEDSKRIVTCVNALAGYTNEEIETIGHIKLMHETITTENTMLREELNRLQAQISGAVASFNPLSHEQSK
jgi:hypothetical protein